MPAQLTTKEFVARSKQVHPDKFTYEKTVYVNAKTKVILTCIKHGTMTQNTGNHLFGSGCPKCASEATADNQRTDPKKFFADCKKIHKGFYSYKKSKYVSLFTKITITCPVHGDFVQIPANHRNGHGCRQCKIDGHSKLTTLTHGEFVTRSNKIHDNAYTYPDRYLNGHRKINIECSDHGLFSQMPYQHLQGNGCPRCSNRQSKIENRVVTFVEKHAVVIQRSRSIIPPLELDIYIPKKKLAIEINGNYWHSELHKHYGAHYEKAKACAEKRIRLLQFWESDVRENGRIVASIILNALGKSRSIYARKTKIRKLDSKATRQFQNDTHLQGYIPATIAYGLYDGGALVAAMSFGKPRFNKDYEWELLRFSSQLGTSVVGGASKLMAHFLKETECKSLLSYADIMISKGDVYRKLGFIKSHTSKPNYHWLKRGSALSRYQTQKHKLAKVLGTAFDSTKSEAVNMTAAGYVKVYDAGNLVFTFNR